MMKMYKKDRRF